MNSDDNDDVPWGTDPAGPDAAARQARRNNLPAGERPNPFLRATSFIPADAVPAVAAFRTPVATAAPRINRPALLTGLAVLTAAVVIVVVHGLSSGTATTGPAASAAAAPSSSPTSAASMSPMAVAPVVSISRMTVMVTATTTATTTARVTAPPVLPAATVRSQAPLGNTTTAAAGAATRLSVSATGSAVPGGVAVTASVDTGGAPVTVTVHLFGPQGNQQIALAPAAAGGRTYSRTVHTGVGVVAVTVSATAGNRSASSAPFTVRVPS